MCPFMLLWSCWRACILRANSSSRHLKICPQLSHFQWALFQTFTVCADGLASLVVEVSLLKGSSPRVNTSLSIPNSWKPEDWNLDAVAGQVGITKKAHSWSQSNGVGAAQQSPCKGLDTVGVESESVFSSVITSMHFLPLKSGSGSACEVVETSWTRWRCIGTAAQMQNDQSYISVYPNILGLAYPSKNFNIRWIIHLMITGYVCSMKLIKESKKWIPVLKREHTLLIFVIC